MFSANIRITGAKVPTLNSNSFHSVSELSVTITTPKQITTITKIRRVNLEIQFVDFQSGKDIDILANVDKRIEIKLQRSYPMVST